MKVRNNALKSSLITNPHENMRPSSEKKKGFINSIRKINVLSSIKNYILHKFQSNTVKHYPTFSTEMPPTSPICEKNKLAAKKIEQENIKAIGYCKELTSDEKMNYLQLNKLGSAILTHPNYSETIGIFRTSANALERDKLVSHLLAGKPLKEYLLNKDIVDIKIYTSAYKRIAANLIEKNIHSLETPPESIHKLADAIQQKSALLKEISTQNSTNQDKREQLKELDKNAQHAFLSLEKTPLTLQLVIPLFAEITKNKEINKMGAYNLATCFAPSLVTRSDLPPDSQFKLNSDAQIYIEALINHDLKLQSYDV
ncbi:MULTISPECIES: RhoGAP domain-containing protein [Providencia]|uniref:RhoGAP domain-containing protein n=1 Tax=Providencia TaxID=586 RepID=UPI0015EB5F2F|nr:MULTISPECIES: RhoGAP domain-containing protein [Providencia]ELR5137581.1 hypothetical protein [Providencia rettgeri]ELR5167041.1 hypothetical protein [Providencia rettgeri]QLQ95317.1 hypothetical protein H0907_08740 [Providencia rettgeri]WEB85924.1 hypothetical protein LVJ10_08765 [Providencia rettgeri]HCH7934323.1 hypothetical protein [Providencia rettgeri]